MQATGGGHARRTTPDRARTLLVGVLAVLLANLAAQPARALRHVDDTDWLAFAAGARILDSGSSCVYCHDDQARVETAALGYTPVGSGFPNPYANPPLLAWALRPLGRLPLPAGLVVMEVASLLALGATAFMARRRLRGVAGGAATAVTVAALASLPGAETLALGQWDALLVAAAVAAVLLVERGRDVDAGALLGLLLVKPQLVWLVVPALVLARRWRVLAGFAAVAAVWLGSALVIVGGAGIRQWADLVLTRHVGETARTVGVPGAIAVVTHSGSAGFVAGASLAAVAVAAMVALRHRLRSDVTAAVGLGIGLSVACAPHVFSADLLLMAVPLLVLARSSGSRALAWALALSAAWALDSLVLGGGVAVEALACAGISAELALTLWKGAARDVRVQQVGAPPLPLAT